LKDNCIMQLSFKTSSRPRPKSLSQHDLFILIARERI